LFNAGEFNGCCDGHDACYENCYQTKKQCDDKFEGCLTGVCNKWAAEENWNLIQKLGKYGPFIGDLLFYYLII
jgi:hypothetical protein